MQLDDSDLGRLDKLEDHAGKTEGRLGAIETTQVDHGRKLDGIGNTLSSINLALTRYDARPVFKLADVISNARDIFAIAAVCAGFALWYVTTLTAKSDTILAKDTEILAIKLAHTNERLNWLHAQFNWRPTFEAVKP